jgi:hypothetical protein
MTQTAETTFRPRQRLSDGTILHLPVPTEVVRRIDDLAYREGSTRAAWVRRLLISVANNGAAA